MGPEIHTRFIRLFITFECTHCYQFVLHDDHSYFVFLVFFLGFGENCRVLEWVLKRCDNEDVADVSPIGYIPKPGTINTDGLGEIDTKKLFEIPKEYWLEECENLRTYYDEQLGEDLPKAIDDELNALKERLNQESA